MKILFNCLLSFLIMVTAAQLRADDQPVDSSMDSAAFTETVVANADGVLLRVVVDENGREDTGTAEMRFFQKEGGGDELYPADLPLVWETAEPTDGVPEIDQVTDQSTWGLWRYRYYNYGWSRPYYYRTYTPSYYYYGSWYNYSYGSCYSTPAYRYYSYYH